jgi:hypothetical protein
MTQPMPDQVAAALGLLREEADIWTTSAGQLDAVSGKASSLKIDISLVYPIWDEFLTVYNEVAQLVADRTGQGRAATAAIGEALSAIAGVYEDEERANLHAVHNLR